MSIVPKLTGSGVAVKVGTGSREMPSHNKLAGPTAGVRVIDIDSLMLFVDPGAFDGLN